MGFCRKGSQGLILALLLSSCALKSFDVNVAVGAKAPAAVASGQSFYAIQSGNWKARNYAKVFPQGTSISFLDYTFGDRGTPVGDAVRNLAPHYVEIHLLNGPHIRAGDCQAYEACHNYNLRTWDAAVAAGTPGILHYVAERTRWWKGVFSKFPSVVPLLSPELEHDLSEASFRTLSDVVHKEWPQVQLVNSPGPFGWAGRYRNAWLERHGVTNISDGDIVSTDGTDALVNFDKAKFIAASPNAKLREYWTCDYNCCSGVKVPPKLRTQCPTQAVYQGMPQ